MVLPVSKVLELLSSCCKSNGTMEIEKHTHLTRVCAYTAEVDQAIKLLMRQECRNYNLLTTYIIYNDGLVVLGAPVAS